MACKQRYRRSGSQAPRRKAAEHRRNTTTRALLAGAGVDTVRLKVSRPLRGGCRLTLQPLAEPADLRSLLDLVSLPNAKWMRRIRPFIHRVRQYQAALFEICFDQSNATNKEPYIFAHGF